MSRRWYAVAVAIAAIGAVGFGLFGPSGDSSDAARVRPDAVAAHGTRMLAGSAIHADRRIQPLRHGWLQFDATTASGWVLVVALLAAVGNDVRLSSGIRNRAPPP